MNDRMRAIAILREAKQILAERLTERVLEAAEEILSDARGESYMNDIESVHEQVGMKLAHVNQMLSNLPTEDESSQATAAAQYDDGDAFTATTGDAANVQPLFVTDTTAALPGPVYTPTPALPAPRPMGETSTTDTSKSQPRSFQAFAAQIKWVTCWPLGAHWQRCSTWKKRGRLPARRCSPIACGGTKASCDGRCSCARKSRTAVTIARSRCCTIASG